MKRNTLVGLSLLVVANVSRAAIDFTPVPTEFMFSGVKFQQLLFKDNGRTVSYTQPRGWSYSGGAAKIRFTPPDVPQAQAEIEQSPLQAPQKFDDETKKALQQKTLAALPPDSANVTVVSEEMNPLLVNGNDTYAITVAYQAYGQEFVTSVLHLNTTDTQLRFRTTARKADFEKVHAAFRGSVFSWQWK